MAVAQFRDGVKVIVLPALVQAQIAKATGEVAVGSNVVLNLYQSELRQGTAGRHALLLADLPDLEQLPALLEAEFKRSTGRPGEYFFPADKASMMSAEQLEPCILSCLAMRYVCNSLQLPGGFLPAPPTTACKFLPSVPQQEWCATRACHYESMFPPERRWLCTASCPFRASTARRTMYGALRC